MADSNRNMTFFVLCFILGAIAGGALVTRFSGYVPPVIVRSDTVAIERWDTVFIDKPTEVTRYVVRHDTLKNIQFVNLTDEELLRKFDSLNLEVTIPISQAIYRDTTENAKYEAFVSGYDARLDSIYIECLNRELTVTNTERLKTSRFGVGLQLGVGVSPQGLAVPYLGVGVHYRLW